MDVISYEYTRHRREFGRHPAFGDSKAVSESVVVEGAAEDAKEWQDKKSSTVELDCVPVMSEHWVRGGGEGGEGGKGRRMGRGLACSCAGTKAANRGAREAEKRRGRGEGGYSCEPRHAHTARTMS